MRPRTRASSRAGTQRSGRPRRAAPRSSSRPAADCTGIASVWLPGTRIRTSTPFRARSTTAVRRRRSAMNKSCRSTAVAGRWPWSARGPDRMGCCASDGELTTEMLQGPGPASAGGRAPRPRGLAVQSIQFSVKADWMPADEWSGDPQHAVPPLDAGAGTIAAHFFEIAAPPVKAYPPVHDDGSPVGPAGRRAPGCSGRKGRNRSTFILPGGARSGGRARSLNEPKASTRTRDLDGRRGRDRGTRP